MTPAAVCFDLDDTLYEYHQYARAGLRAAAAYLENQTGKQLRDELLSIYFIEETQTGTFDELLRRHDLPRDMVPKLVEAFHSAETPLCPYAATTTVLRRLGQSYWLGLITDGRGGDAKLERLRLTGYFDTTLVTPTIDASKHEHHVFERVLDELEVSPGDAVYIGDDPRVDFRVANDLGLETVRLRRGRYRSVTPETPSHSADQQVTDLATVPRLLDEESPRPPSES